MHKGVKVWARDTGRGGIKCFVEGSSSPISQRNIESSEPEFELSADNRRRKIRNILAEAKANTEPLTGSSSMSSVNAHSAPSTKLDKQLLNEFQMMESSPDEPMVALVGAAKGRLDPGGLPVPPAVVVDAKAESLTCRRSP